MTSRYLWFGYFGGLNFHQVLNTIHGFLDVMVPELEFNALMVVLLVKGHDAME